MKWDRIGGPLLAIVIGVVAMLLLAHWAACEADEGFCLVTDEF